MSIGHLLIIVALPLAAQTKTQPLPSFDAAFIKVDNSESHSSDWDLIRIKAAVDMFVIDHLDNIPTEN
jgi:hypothetical protein